MISSNPQNNAVAAVPSRAATVDPLAEQDFAVASSLPTHDPEAVNASLPPIPAANPAHRAFSSAMTVYIVATVASIAFLGPLGANVSVLGCLLLPKQPADLPSAILDLYPRPPNPI